MRPFGFSLALSLLYFSGIYGSFIPPLKKAEPYGNANQTALQEFTISAGSIKATFLPYGATLKNLWVTDRWGQARDIALGYDDPALYMQPTTHAPRFGVQIGRTADRMNSTFEVDGVTYHALTNLHPTEDPQLNLTFHGGEGFDYRNWTVVKHTKDTLVLNYFSPNGEAGYPGDVDFWVIHTVKAPATWHIQMWASASQNTPLLPTNHPYLQLNAFNASERGSLSQTFYMKSHRYQTTDENLLWNGTIDELAPGSPADFYSKPKSISDGFWDAKFCGDNCTGYDALFIYDTPHTRDEVVASLWSEDSGIRLDMSTDQPCIAFYTCGELKNNTAPRKAAHGGGYYDQYNCVLFEHQGYGDALHLPQLDQNPIYGPGRDFTGEITYAFSVLQ
ncbi:hypothetical protein VNI00_011763 [Paramarasmius palmivorus]|uniref:Aldose 1-epimerase n=1 Tax=Paramarasmius palmivorus TaxID=297713 RepID=A0AAW0C9Q0_9AGAR